MTPSVKEQLESLLFAPARYDKVAVDKYYESTPSKFKYIYDVCGSYFTIFTCADVFKTLSEPGRPHAEYFAHVYSEEHWHYKLLEHDMRNLGYDVHKVAQKFDYGNRRAVGDIFVSYKDAKNPVGILGLVYVLERAAIEVTQEFIQRIENAYGLGSGTNSVTSLSVKHSNVPGERKHVEDSIEYMSCLSYADLELVFTEVIRTGSLLCSNTVPYVGDAAMELALEDCKC
jgi:hypothetical protein